MPYAIASLKLLFNIYFPPSLVTCPAIVRQPIIGHLHISNLHNTAKTNSMENSLFRNGWLGNMGSRQAPAD